MTTLLLTLVLLAPPALPAPGGALPARRAPSAAEQEEESADDELADEPPRVVSPPGPGRIRVDLQAGAGALSGETVGSAGGELRIGLVQPVALALGGEAHFDADGSAGWAARAALRVQGDLSPAPFLELGAALLAGGDKAGVAGLGVAFPVTWRTGASLGARGLYVPEDGSVGGFGVLALTFAP